MPLKIVLEGCPGSGKTTTLRTIRSFFSLYNAFMISYTLPTIEVGIVGEAATDLFAKEPDINRCTSEAQGKIISMILAREQEHQDKDIIIFDRAVYSSAVFVPRDLDPMLLDIISYEEKKYDMTYLFHPDNCPLVNTSVRIEDEQRRQQLHLEFLEYVNCHKIPFFTLKGENMERSRVIIEDIFCRVWGNLSEQRTD